MSIKHIVNKINKVKANKTEVKSVAYQSEQRNKKLSKLEIEKDSFSYKKGRGTNPNSLKNLKPYEKGQSGNPGGRPKKFSQLKNQLDKWGDKVEFDNWGWDNYTNRQKVIIGIWKRASNGNRQDLDILLQLGLLKEDTFK